MCSITDLMNRKVRKITVRNFILSESPEIVYLQEMKLDVINDTILKEVLGGDIKRKYMLMQLILPEEF
jgi:hypothetical protein